MFIQPSVPAHIVFAIAMPATIEFDHQVLFAAKEINDIGTKWNLTDELVPVEPAVTQFAPKPVFGFRFISAQGASSCC